MKRIKFIKPASSRLFFLFIAIVPLLSFEDKIKESFEASDFKNASLFFSKEITEQTGAMIGKVKGKIMVRGDSIEAYIIYNNTVKTVGFDGRHPYEIVDSKRFVDKNIESVPPEIDIRSFINPAIALSSSEESEREGMTMFYPKTKEIDSAGVWSTEGKIDSVLVFRKNLLLVKTLYKNYADGFPLYIETTDFEKKTIEKVNHYKVYLER
ncbi:MAG: hypothetical protein AB7T10_07185 [bacterium]